MRFTALVHHVTVDRLRESYRAISPSAAPGIDGVTWRDYGVDLEANLHDLHARVQGGAYRASPTRRVFIPKTDGRLRPLGVAALEDKIVQRAVVEVLNAVYEEDFLGFSYGFRPGRRPLDALAVALERKRVNWVLDADIRDFFTQLDQGWLERFLERRIADKRVLRLIEKWLRAGVIEDGEWSETEAGTAQGASVSPLLSNVFLHYVFDLWADQWRRRRARGDVVLVRFADDFQAGFQHREDAERFLADLRKRFAGLGLELHPDKTRLIEFGRYAVERRKARGDRKPETFEFLGFTHICAKDKHGRFKLKRVTSKKKMRSKLKAVKTEMRRRRHLPIPDKDAGSPGSCKGTTTTTRCPTTARLCVPSDDGSSTTGERRSNAAARKAGQPGSGPTVSPPDGYPSPTSCTPGPTSASTPEPEGGAQCVDAHAGICAGGRRRRRSLPRSWSDHLAPWVACRARFAARAVVLRDRRSDLRTSVVSQRCAGRAAPPRAQGRNQAPVRTPPAAPRARRRAPARRDPAAADPAPARPLAPVNDRHLPGGDQHRGNHLDRTRKTRTDDARQRRPRPVADTRGSAAALPHPPTPALQPSSSHTSAILLAPSSSGHADVIRTSPARRLGDPRMCFMRPTDTVEQADEYSRTRVPRTPPAVRAVRMESTAPPQRRGIAPSTESRQVDPGTDGGCASGLPPAGGALRAVATLSSAVLTVSVRGGG